jgi:ABC-type multidrug transport system fused ATPase/permease subunit
MDIPAGRKIGLVGHSGCGKSTITNLLLRFYDYNEGEIKIDGKSLKDYDIGELRRSIGYVM